MLGGWVRWGCDCGVCRVCIVMLGIFYYKINYRVMCICVGVTHLQFLFTQIVYVKAFECNREPRAAGYIWPTLFIGDINTWTWPSRLGESRIRDRKIWSRVPRDSDPRMTVLAKSSSNCKRQTRPLVRDSAPHQQTRNCLTIITWS
jgi:hypothetical protein